MMSRENALSLYDKTKEKKIHILNGEEKHEVYRKNKPCF
jgi:hypothetical protein